MTDFESNPAVSGSAVPPRLSAAGRRPWTLRALALLVGVLVPLGCLEVLLRTLPVYDPPRRMAVNSANPVLRFEPDREFLWSTGWNFPIVNAGKTNNFGFVSDFDYHPDAAGPLLAVIGDNYVEAAMVSFAQTCAGRLATKLAGRARVYAFGMSGSPLSQYLAFADYARDTFRPHGLAVIIIANDYDESLLKYRPVPGFHYFVKGGDGRLQLERTDFEQTFLQRLIRAAALARYFAGNADVRHAGEHVRRTLSSWWETLSGGEEEREPSQVAGHGEREPSVVAASAAPELLRVTESKRVVDAFLDRLPEASGLDPARIAFVVEGMRPNLYDTTRLEEAAGSFRDLMRRYFMVEASRTGYEIIDLQPVMIAHYAEHQERFEWPQDGHWNALGHELCSGAVASSNLLSREAPWVQGETPAAKENGDDRSALR